MGLERFAQSVRATRAGQVEERPGGGTGLAQALQRGGAVAALGLLADGADVVELQDGALTLRVARVEGGATVSTRSRDGGTTEQRLSLATPVLDLTAALHDPTQRLRWHEGQWWSGPGPAELIVPAISPEQLGAAGFREAFGLRYSYMAGAMAAGIASPRLVTALGAAGFLGSFGAGGLPLEAIGDAVREVRRAGVPAAFNLLHNPSEPSVEEATVDLYLEHGCRVVEASAFMGLTPALVRFRLAGAREEHGQVHAPNRVIAKVSRVEVAEALLRPAPARLLDELVAKRAITRAQAELGRRLPIAQDITVEADSAGHTDRRPLGALVPLLRRLADRIASELDGAPARVGAAGGIGDPWTLAGALALGADYVVTGSINQATCEADTSPAVRELLAAASSSDVAQAPAPDMFEFGASVQVLTRGTLYAQRAARLYELYRAHPSLESIPAAERERIERQILQRSFDEIWLETEAFWSARSPAELERAARDPRHRLALCVRWYLGQSSRWARAGEPTRRRDFQVWCGPAMGLFNDWTRGTWLEPLEARSAVDVARALMVATAVVQRVNLAASVGPLPLAARRVLPNLGIDRRAVGGSSLG
jgi:trans-AT polyketide synthase/acyltransferase/oxidoreductase domain-containing protein